MRGTFRNSGVKAWALGGCAAVALAQAGVLADEPGVSADRVRYTIAAQDLGPALNEFGLQSQVEILFSPGIASTKTSPGVIGDLAPTAALDALLAGTGLTYHVAGLDTIVVEDPAARADEDPQPLTVLAQAETGTSTGRSREKIIVTGQKREEYIQDVPIAISAFSQDDLTLSQIAGGPDLITQIPNFTFTKTNFSSYSIQIRGIGTQAISATTDPAVAVAFNNTPFIRNRFFEQEFYDMERVEVLRGPQGTLYGRNATAGVVNLISAKPSFDKELRLSADKGNYNSSRIEGMINVPLVDDQLALRFAGAWTKRDGYATNDILGGSIDGRDLWSTRLSLLFAPNDRINANLIWEHFEEDDDRIRSGKQLCKTHEVTEVAGFPTTHFQTLPESGQSILLAGVQGSFSQGCERASLYSPESFQTPNGLALAYYKPLGAVFLPEALDDPYENRTQSQDLRVIESIVDPRYRAKSDIGEFQIDIDIADNLTFTSETAYSADQVWSTQDFNRFATAQGAWLQPDEVNSREDLLLEGPEGGIFCDPQIGCSDRLVALDLATSDARQFSQEFRLASSYAGPFNFSLGANFLRSDSVDKYYVFINSLTIISARAPYGSFGHELSPYVAGETDGRECMITGTRPPDATGSEQILQCTYIDPNPIESLDDLGHNYFLSNNPFKLISYAAFGEAYWNITDTLKLTAGLRYSVDKKQAPLIPSWVLASNTVGYSVAEVIDQEWKEPTGRLVLDWKPDLAFTDETLIYGSYAHGYKAGGANPPRYGIAIYVGGDAPDIIAAQSAVRPRTFEPEFVDAFEVGSKNTFADGDVTLNLAAFYYDYEGYQVSEIVDRTAINRNFDAEVWGAEIEGEWWALENLRLSFKGGYQKTRIADGEQAIDLMDRTAGDPRWIVTKPFPSIPSNCILPTWLYIGNTSAPGNPELVNLGGKGGGNPGGCEWAYVFGEDPGDHSTGHGSNINYADWSTNPDDYPGWPDGLPITNGMAYPGWDPSTAPNNGEGIFKPLGGAELPNAPNYTATISADYILPLSPDWSLTFHTDLHYQSESWWRVFQDHEYARLNEYYTMNLAAILKSEDGWNIMGYIKNVTDETAITGAFLNSDDTGLTTNVFLTEPRLYGVRVTKDWVGGDFLGSMFDLGGKRDPNTPHPLTLTVGRQIQRHDAPDQNLEPSFAGLFREELDVFGEAPDPDLDWGDGRDYELSYRPNSGPWKISAAVRYGKTNGAAKDSLTARDDSDEACGFGGPYAFFCPIYEYYYGYSPYFSAEDWSYASPVREREEHTLIDFAVGRDIGVGGLTRSTLGFGVRYAQFKSSTTNVHFDGIPDWEIADGFIAPGLKYPVGSGYDATRSRRTASFAAMRKFEGTGPILEWEGSRRLLGGDDTGRVDLDWALSGGALFGKQETEITGTETASYYASTGFGWYVFNEPIAGPYDTSIDVRRTEDVTVPVAGASLGLAYRIDRYSIGAGYRWERYYDVLDGGDQNEALDVDRTIDGPYFNISVGFGG